ncbi:MAG: hypothetical protein HYS13_23830 [Planctomycetia bacterium]|nr:hypothetical protein [Planctomycetia bacterium]
MKGASVPGDGPVPMAVRTATFQDNTKWPEKGRGGRKFGWRNRLSPASKGDFFPGFVLVIVLVLDLIADNDDEDDEGTKFEYEYDDETSE